jgi:ketosteroid isomerase-like protein
VSADHLETVRRIYTGLSQGNFRASAPLLDEHVVMVIPPGFGIEMAAGRYVGAEGVAEYTRGFLRPMADFSMEAEELVPAGDSVVVAVRQRGTGAVSGVPTEMRYFTVWSFRGSRVIRIESFRERGEALAAAGLDP